MSLVLGVIAVVAIVAGVALLATSGDRGFADVSPDGLEVALPDDRALTSVDVEAVRFGLAFRGYRMQDVDDVLDRLAEEIRDRDERIVELSRDVDERSRSGRTPIESTPPEPFRPTSGTPLPQEAEGSPSTAAMPTLVAEVGAPDESAPPDPYSRPQPQPQPQPEAATVLEAGPVPENESESGLPSIPHPAPADPISASTPATEPTPFLTPTSTPAAEADPPIAPRPADPGVGATDDARTEGFALPADTAFGTPGPVAPAPDSATPDYVHTVPLPETVSDDPALDPAQPTDPPPATPKPESEQVTPETVWGLEQPAPTQPAEHRGPETAAP